MGTRVVSLTALSVLLSLVLVVPVIAGERVRVEVEIIYASNQPRPTEGVLSDLEGQLRSTFSFASYRLLERRTMELSRGRVGRTSVPGGKGLSVELREVRGNRAKLMVRVSDRGQMLLRTTVSMSPGQKVLLGGPAYKDGSLIIAIGAVF